MRKLENTPIEGIKDAVMGYTVLVLAMMSFVVTMWAIIAVARMLVG